ncbi:hypothetical protein Poli38472_000648 [Pythium oligandrum]|uniref:Uncharacterized protein n=1 Tax=Pythium oligandrum TaxID=41045 RepID=A0A8K1CC42_PYTOL|nr:hypothetical protein Poli38472_000648 [Pythium oligandrum]|eukprot:TMW60606.1 hypothetical protein Poli38472_000648 [Pythium oligandrum]
MEHGDSSDGEDVMAYFLPNGIADDSPPKRSTMMSSFGPIGGRVSTTSSTTTTNRQPAFSGLGASTSAASLLSSPRGNFLLSDLGGGLHQPRSSDFGETHTPRAFGFAKPEVKIEEASSSTSPQVSEPGDGNVTPPRSGSDKKAKESKKDKHKKDKAERKKTGAKSKKDKRETSSSGKGDLIDELEFVDPVPKNSPSVFASATTTISNGVYNGLRFARTGVSVAFSSLSTGWGKVSDQLNIKGVLFSGFSYLESFLAVVFSVILLLSLHGASWFIRIHRVAFRAILTHRHVGFCFAFLYAFPFLVQYVFPWAPPWAPVCLWYAFLVQLFCTNGPTAMVTTFRIILPLVFLVEGISHHSFLLDLNGAELLLASFILSALKTSNLCSPIFLLSLAAQCLSAVFLGSELVVQWLQMALALYSLHSMAATDEEWAGLRDEEEELSCQSMSMHHSIADYNYQPAPSAPSIQKTKRLDRRALAYVRGRKLR